MRILSTVDSKGGVSVVMNGSVGGCTIDAIYLGGEVSGSKSMKWDCGQS